MLEFDRPATPCDHHRPKFGCRGCIDIEREGALETFYKETAPPTCTRCRAPMMIATGHRMAMIIEYSCMSCPASQKVNAT